MIEYFREMFSYSFMVRAAIIGLSVSICSAIVGVNLVQKKFSMIGHALSQISFAALALALCFHLNPLSVSLPVTILAAYFLLRIKYNSGINADARLALLSTLSIAIGVLFISMSTGINTDICNYLFGSLLAADGVEMLFSIVLVIVVLLIYAIYYQKILLITSDEIFARAAAVKVEFFNALLAFLTAILIVMGIRTLGTLLISTLLVFPAMTALTIARSYKRVIIISLSIAILAFVIGLCLSYSYALPTGAGITLVNASFFAIAYVWKKLTGSRA